MRARKDSTTCASGTLSGLPLTPAAADTRTVCHDTSRRTTTEHQRPPRSGVPAGIRGGVWGTTDDRGSEYTASSAGRVVSDDLSPAAARTARYERGAQKKLSRLFQVVIFEALFKRTDICYCTSNILVVGAQKGANIVDECQQSILAGTFPPLDTNTLYSPGNSLFCFL